MTARDPAPMILTCPACATRYRVAEQEFAGSTGRTVRCANCGHSWFEPASGPEPPPGDGALRHDPATNFDARFTLPADEPTAAPLPRLEVSSRAPPFALRAARRGWAMVLWAVAAAAIVLVVAIAAVSVHRQVVAVRPAVARPDTASAGTAATGAAAAGTVATPGTGLAIRGITPTRIADGLIVDGEVANVASSPRDVPRLRVALQDSAQKEVQFKMLDPPKPRLQPGEATHFAIPFAHPPNGATGVVVTFVAP